MDLYGCHFEYAGITSRLYDLIFATVDTSKYLSLSGKVESVSFFNKKNKKNFYLGDTYDSSTISFEAEIVSKKIIDRVNQRNIEKWLFHQPDYCKLYIDMNDDPYGECYEVINGEVKRLYLNCRFVNPEKIERGGGLAGYRFTVECDSYMMWQDPITCTYSFESTGSSFNTVISVDVDTDINDYVYPKVVITMGSVGGDIIISNLTDDSTRETTFIGLTKNITFTMKGEGINFVSGDNYSKFSDRNFIRLLDGENKLSLYGDITGIEFEFQNQRYL